MWFSQNWGHGSKPYSRYVVLGKLDHLSKVSILYESFTSKKQLATLQSSCEYQVRESIYIYLGSVSLTNPSLFSPTDPPLSPFIVFVLLDKTGALCGAW